MATTAAEPKSMNEAFEAAFADGMSALQSEGVVTAAGEPADPTPEPTPDASPAAEAPAEPEAPAPDPAAEPTGALGAEAQAEPPAEDPLAGTEPFTFEADGKAIPVDGILLADGGAIIPPEKLDAVRSYFADAAREMTQGRTASARLEAMTREMGTLTHQVGEDTYRGAAAFEVVKAEAAATLEGSKAVIAALANPSIVTELALAYQNNDAARAQQILRDLTERASGAYERTQLQGLRKADRLQMAGVPQAPPSVEQAFSGALTELRQSAAQPQFAWLNTLTDDDWKAAERQFGPVKSTIVRPATEAEVRASNGQLRAGTLVRDFGPMLPWLEDRVAYRNAETARTTQTTQQVKDASKAGAHNAAVTGRRQPPKQAAKPSAPAIKDERPSKAAKWNTLFETGMAEIGMK